MISRRKWLQSLGIAFGATLTPKAYPVAGSERETRNGTLPMQVYP